MYIYPFRMLFWRSLFELWVRVSVADFSKRPTVGFCAHVDISLQEHLLEVNTSVASRLTLKMSMTLIFGKTMAFDLAHGSRLSSL